MMQRIIDGAPPIWPFDVLGIFEGCVVLRSNAGQVRAIHILHLKRLVLLDLFDGNGPMLRRMFPSGGPREWDHHNVASCLIVAAYAAGRLEEESLRVLGVRPVYRFTRSGAGRVLLLPVRSAEPWPFEASTTDEVTNREP